MVTGMVYDLARDDWTWNGELKIDDFEEKFLKPKEFSNGDFGFWDVRSDFFITGPEESCFFMCSISLDPENY